MLNSQLARRKRKPPQQKHLYPKDYQVWMTWRIRWYLIIAITIIYVLFLIVGLIGFWITKDSHYLLFITPMALIPFVRYLVPMDEKRYELRLASINASKERDELKARVHTLETELLRQQEQLPTT